MSARKPQIAVSVSIKTAGSKLSYNSKLCRRTASPKPPPLMKFSFEGLSATFNLGGTTPATETFSGTGCGSDVLSGWTITYTILGQSHSQPASFQAGVPNTVFTLQGGGGSATSQLQITPGSPAQVALTVTLSGSYNGLVINVPQVPITATPVASC